MGLFAIGQVSKRDLQDNSAILATLRQPPPDVRRLADKAYALWIDDPSHGSLHFKKLAGHEDLWSVRIGRQYRALAQRRDDLLIWVWIGYHSEFDRLIA